MKKLNALIVLFTLIGLHMGCNLLDDPTDENETTIKQFTSTDFGTISLETGESVSIIPGAVPPDNNGNPATVSFTIETGVEKPAALNAGATFRSELIKFGPEYFNFRWPLLISIPYDDGVDPMTLAVMHYNYSSGKWDIIPKAGIDTDKKIVYFNSLTLGIFGLAELSNMYRSFDWCDGGIRFHPSNSEYFYTLTVATVQNPEYAWQQSWLLSVGDVAAATGVRNNKPLEYTFGYLVQASYKFWISRTKPGTFSHLPVTETYSVPTNTVKLDEVNICPQSFSTTADLNLCSPWVDVFMPSGGTWVEGGPEGWPEPTKTYGTGDFQATLNWINNETHRTDLDIHLYGPDGEHVYFWNETSADGSLELDLDWQEESGNATENIYSLKDMPSGKYEIKVKLYSGDATNFNVRIIRFGEVKNYSGSLQSSGDEVLVDSFTL